MELLEMPVSERAETEVPVRLEEQELDRIAFELWQRGSLPALAKEVEAELEDVACHASCL